MKRAMKILLALAVPIGAVGIWLAARGPDKVDPLATAATFPVARGDLEVTITEDGTLVAKESKKVCPEFRGESKVVFLMEEGKSVKEGDVVCRFDGTMLQRDIDTQRLEVKQARAKVVTTASELTVQITDNAQATKKAQLTLDLSKLKLEKYRDGDAPQDRSTLQVTIKQDETAFNKAQTLHDSTKKLVALNEKYVKKSELEDSAIELERATVKLNGSRRALEIFERYTMPMQMRELTNAVDEAETTLANEQEKARAKLTQKQTDKEEAEQKLKQLEEQLAEREKDLEKMTLKAPCPGILIYGDPQSPWYRNRIKIGDTIWGDSDFTIMTIPDLRVMQVKIDVHEAEIEKVKLGQTAIVTMDTYPGLVLHGTVSQVADIAASNNPWSDSHSEIKRFAVQIVLADTGERQLKPGISAKAVIQVGHLKDVMFVPLQCVFLENGETSCFVQGPTGTIRKKVEVGLSSDSYTEIKSGLEVGERVLLHNQFLRKDGSAPDKPATDKPSDGKQPAAPPAAAPAAVEATAKKDEAR